MYEDNDLALYRFVLLCISSDLPATRKCCGFLSYNAKKGKFSLYNLIQSAVKKLRKFIGDIGVFSLPVPVVPYHNRTVERISPFSAKICGGGVLSR